MVCLLYLLVSDWYRATFFSEKLITCCDFTTCATIVYDPEVKHNAMSSNNNCAKVRAFNTN